MFDLVHEICEFFTNSQNGQKLHPLPEISLNLKDPLLIITKNIHFILKQIFEPL